MLSIGNTYRIIVMAPILNDMCPLLKEACIVHFCELLEMFIVNFNHTIHNKYMENRELMTAIWDRYNLPSSALIDYAKKEKTPLLAYRFLPKIMEDISDPDNLYRPFLQRILKETEEAMEKEVIDYIMPKMCKEKNSENYQVQLFVGAQLLDMIYTILGLYCARLNNVSDDQWHMLKVQLRLNLDTLLIDASLELIK